MVCMSCASCAPADERFLLAILLWLLAFGANGHLQLIPASNALSLNLYHLIAACFCCTRGGVNVDRMRGSAEVCHPKRILSLIPAELKKAEPAVSSEEPVTHSNHRANSNDNPCYAYQGLQGRFGFPTKQDERFYSSSAHFFYTSNPPVLTLLVA